MQNKTSFKDLYPYFIIFFWAFVFSLIKLHPIFEQDLFWQIRSGFDLTNTHRFPLVDDWSFSGKGNSWLNIQWISTLVLALIYKLGSIPGLVIFRGLLCFILGTLFCLICKKSSDEKQTNLNLILMPPLVFLSLIFRIELRSDTFQFLIFALLILLWSNSLIGKLQENETGKRTCITYLLCLLAVNIHTGTAPFIFVSAGAILFSTHFKSGWKDTLKYLVPLFFIFLINPYPIESFRVLFEHFRYYSYNVMPNPDHQPLQAHHFRIDIFGFSGWSFIILAALSFAEFFFRANEKRQTKRNLHELVLYIPLFLFFFLSLNRIRSFPYFAIYSIPFAANALQEIRRTIVPKFSLFNEACLFIVLFIFVIHSKDRFSFPSLTISKKMFPVESTKFISEKKPQGNIYHTYAYGAYLVWFLKEYPLFVDTRETMYRHLQKRLLEAYFSAEIFKKLVDDFKINTLLLPIPKTQFNPDKGFDDVIERYSPKSEWALVYFDAISIVVLRRTPENKKIIEENEFRFLKPNLPASYFLFFKTKPKDFEEKMRLEIERCLKNQPYQTYCAVAKSVLLRTSGNPQDMNQAIELLESARKHAVDPMDRNLLTEMHLLYQRLGRPGKASEISAILGPSEVIKIQ